MIAGGGLAVESVDDVPVAWSARSLDEWWEATRDVSRVLTDLLGRLSVDEAQALRAAAESRLQEFVADDGSVAAVGVARVVLATPA